MEKRSSMKDSGLSFLFRATEGATPAEEKPQDVSPEQAESARRSLIQPSRTFPAVIRVVGVGGAGTNAINRMLEAGPRRRGVHRRQHRRAGPCHVRGRPQAAHRPGADQGPGRRFRPQGRPRSRARRLRRDQDHAQGQRHGVHHRGRGRRHRHRCRAGGRRDRQVSGRTDHRRGVAAVRLRGQAPRRCRRSKACACCGRRPTRSSWCPTTSCFWWPTGAPPWSMRCGWPTTCCARACRASATWSPCPGSSTSTWPTCAPS